jgi:hypothetical protein
LEVIKQGSQAGFLHRLILIAMAEKSAEHAEKDLAEHGQPVPQPLESSIYPLPDPKLNHEQSAINHLQGPPVVRLVALKDDVLVVRLEDEVVARRGVCRNGHLSPILLY